MVPSIINQGIIGVSNMGKDKQEMFLAGYYIMPKYSESLQDYLDRSKGVICSNIVFEISNKLLKAIRAVHEAGRTYNDLKPSNIMIEW
jgi:serine/threonine protein kinase